MNPADIDNRFKFHPPTDAARKSAHETVREMCGTLAHALNEILPEGREKAVAYTKLEEVMFWSNAAIAREN